MKSILLMLGALTASSLALAGCQSGAPAQIGGSGSTLSDVVTFTVADLDNAEATAKANNDTLAIPCYPALKQWVESIPGAGSAMTVSGLASGFEAGRVTVNGVAAGVPDYVYTGCGPLYMKVHGQLLALIGGAVVAPKL